MCIIAGMFAIPTNAETSYQTPENLLFHRNALAKLKDANKYLYIYDTLTDGIRTREEYIVLDESKSTNLEEFLGVLGAVRLDHPEFMSLKSMFGFYSEESGIVTYFWPYFADNITVEDEQRAIEAARQFIKDVGATPDMSDYALSKLFHDELTERIEYYFDSEGDEINYRIHSVYGALIDGKCVCEGYAESYQMLMNMMGREATCITGYTLDQLDSHGNPYSHEWNLVKLDGKYYHLDATWDDIIIDEKSTTLYSYLHVNDQMALQNRALDRFMYELPSCNSLDLCYFTVEGGFMPKNPTQADIDFLGKKFSDNEVVHVYATEGNAKELLQWYLNHASEILKKSTVKGKSYGGVSVRNEGLLNLKGDRQHTIKVNGGGSTSYNAYVGDKVTINAVSPGAGAKFVRWECSNPDVKFSAPTSMSTTFVMVDEPIEITAVWQQITTTTTTVPTTTAPAGLLGDVNDDGEIDELDAALVARYSAGMINLTPLQQKVADVNDDGEIDELDAAMISRYSAGLIDHF